jgi:trimeric autotransporter adhesin
MKRQALPRIPMFLCLVLALTCASQAQMSLGPGIADSTSAQLISSRTFTFSGSIPGQLDGALSVTFSLYPDQQSATALWTETQVVQVTGEKYSVMLGSTSASGLPQEIFAADQAHWLGVQVNGAEKRYLLVSVPYAMKAVEAERLGGLLPSDFVTVQQLQSALQSAAAPGTSTPTKSTSTGPTGQAALAGTPPQPATDFTDNNTSEVLLVTQQGMGYAIHAITSSQAEAILAQNDSIGGTALHALATNATGASIGVLAETASPSGIAGVFNNQVGGKILSLRNNGVEVVAVDQSGGINASGAISANFFSGNGGGLFNIPNSATTATIANTPNSIVLRDGGGGISANFVNANFLSGNGGGLFNIPNSATTATIFNTPDSIVLRDSGGGISANFVNANFLSGNGGGLFNIPNSATTATIFNTPNSIVLRDSGGGISANFVNANFLSGNGGGLFNIPPSAVNATSQLVPNSVVARDASGNFSAGFINVSGLSATSSQGPAIQGNGLLGIQASTEFGYGLLAGATSTNGVGTALLLTHASASGGKLISGGQGTGAILTNETFSVDVAGNVAFNGGLMKPYATSGTWVANSLVKLTNPGSLSEAQVTMTSPGDTSGVVGVITGLTSGAKIQVAHNGEVFCNFEGGLATTGDYVGISKTTAGDCADLGPNYPNDGQQVVGRVVSTVGLPRVLLFDAELHSNAGGGITINTGAGLAGGPITTTGTISIATGGVTNTMLQNSSVFVTAGAGLSGGGAVPLGGSLTLSNTGVTAFKGRNGNITPTSGDYSFSQISGAATSTQLPIDIAYTSKSNTFGTDQFVQGNMAVTGNLTSPNLAVGKGSFSGFATPASPVLSVTDNGNSSAALSVNSVGSDPAAVLTAAGTNVLLTGPSTGATTVLSTSGNLSLQGTATAHAFSGDGSALTNVSATKIGTLTQADIATSTALSAETAARQSADTTLQTNIDAESAARQSADTTLQNNITAETGARQTDVTNLQTSIGVESAARQSVEASLLSSLSAETTARQSDVSTLQTNINNVSTADAKLTASNTFTAGTQDFSGAGATLPVRSVLTANTPTACIASKELLIKTDAPAGQQLFICDASGTTWNLVGDGAANGVTSFNGRNGSVSPASGDYSFAQISGSAAAGQLPAAVVYNNQSNTFTGNQTVNGSVTATSFSGGGSGLTGVNAATLNGIPSNAFAQLHAINSFTSEQAFAASTAVNPSLNIPAGVAPATPLAGDVWNTGSVIQYRDNASTTRSLVSTPQSGGLQLLKLSASITPASVTSQICTEQSFTVSGITTGDVLLSVLQPSTSSPGLNIAIGGFRVSAANTVAVQFCNVSRNNSTPTSGVYTFALMR